MRLQPYRFKELWIMEYIYKNIMDAYLNFVTY